MLRRTRKKVINIAVVFFSLFALTGLLTGETAMADQHHGRDRGHERTVRRLPAGSRTVWVGKSRYYHNHGVFYRRGPSGFLVVNAPIRAIVLSIPIGSRSVLVGGFTYYLYGRTYYRRVPSGYMVVAPPPETVVVREMAPVVPSKESMEGKVSVTVPLLNVRSGPGMDFPVTCQVHENEMLTIQGYAPDWLYVNIPGGAFGWVMLRYTSYASTNPSPAEG